MRPIALALAAALLLARCHKNDDPPATDADADADADVDADADADADAALDPRCELSLVGPERIVRYGGGPAHTEAFEWSGETFGWVWIEDPNPPDGDADADEDLDHDESLETPRAYFGVLSPRGDLVTGDVKFAEGAVSWPSAAWGRGEWAVAFARGDEAERQIVIRRFSAAGRPIDPETVIDTGDVSRPSILWDGSRFVLAWTRRGAPGAASQVIFETRDDWAGDSLSHGSITHCTSDDCSAAGVASDGRHAAFLYVEGDGDVAALELKILDSSTGRFLGPVPVSANAELGSGLVVPSIAWSAGRFAVAYRDALGPELVVGLFDVEGVERGTVALGDVRAAFVRSSGELFAIPVLAGSGWRLVRIEVNGERVGVDPAVPGWGLRSAAPQRVTWSDRSWAVVFERETVGEDVEVVFDRLDCGDACDHDGDGARSTVGTCCVEDVCGDDCDDADPAALPGAVERCNGLDDDCDQVIDDACSE